MKRNAHGRTLDLLGMRIAGGEWSPGESLPPEPVLGESLEVSRTVVREAVKSLSAKGMVSTGPKVGTRVLDADQWNWFDPDVVRWQSGAGLTRAFLRDLHDLRGVIEPAAVRLAAQRATASDIREIESAYEGMRRAIEEGGDYVGHDLRFHQGLLRASGNRMILQMGKAIGALLRTSFEVSTRRQGGARDSLPLHRAVLDAVLAKDGALAEQATRRLIDSAAADIEQVIASRRKLPKVDEPARPLRKARQRA